MGDFEILAQRLKLLRTKLGLTQKEFADKVGFTQATLSAYENNQKKPSLDIVKDIAEKCHVSIDWLCGLTDKENYDEEIKTYSDMIRILFLISSERPFSLVPCIETNLKSDSATASIIFTDNAMIKFIEEWEKMKELLDRQLIDADVYNLWKEKELIKYNESFDLPFD